MRNLTAEAVYNSSVGTTVGLISWLPPAEAERFHVQLVYYLNISRSNAEETSLFSIEASADGGSDKVCGEVVNYSFNTCTIGNQPLKHRKFMT